MSLSQGGAPLPAAALTRSTSALNGLPSYRLKLVHHRFGRVSDWIAYEASQLPPAVSRELNSVEEDSAATRS